MQLAQAGFYYSPTAESEDNVTCFHCHNSLDQWEEGDDPFREHLAVVPDCAWAIVTAVEKDVTPANDEHDPLEEEFLQARIATFGSSWPFEKKKGWTPQTKKLAEAGWHYVPSAESDDYVRCAYCLLGLDGWEPKDKPIEEHKRRSPECKFIVLSELHKKSRKKKPRASKASRASTQSIANSVVDEKTAFDESAHLDDSIVTTATDVSIASNVSTVSKKGGKAKKGAAKAGRKTTKGKKVEEPEELQEAVVEDSVVEIEPAEPQKKTRGKRTTTDTQIEAKEDSVMEVEPPAPQTKTRGKKRTTTDMQSEAEEDEAAPPKKRASRARVSTAKSVTAHEPSFVADASTMEAPEEISMPKRGAKGRGKASTGSRAASRTASGTRKASARKASATSTASTAPLRQTGLDEGEIDAMLEADLDRAGSDEEMPDVEEAVDPEPEPEPKPKAKRQTKAKAVVKKPASKAALRKASQANVDNEMPDSRKVSQHVAQDEPSHAMDDSVIVTKSHALIHNPYEDLNSQLPVDDAGSADELEIAPAPAKAKAKGKKATGKVSAAATKGKKSQPAKKEVTPAPEVEESDFDEIVEERPAEPERTELRFSSSFEHEPSMLAEAEVPADLVEHFSPKKAAPPAKVAKPAKAVKNAKATKSIKKAPSKAAPVPVKAKKPAPVDEVEIMESEPEMAREPSPSPVRPSQRAPQAQYESPARSAPGGFPSPTPSPQSSNAENEPPSSRPSQKRPPLAPLTPSQGKTNTMLFPATAETTTPTRSIRKDRADGSISPEWALKSSFNWRPVDLETIFLGSPNSKQMNWFHPGNQDKENQPNAKKGTKAQQTILTSPEKRMTVEEWIRYNAGKGEEKLRIECERAVGRFESQGVNALKALEGLEVLD